MAVFRILEAKARPGAVEQIADLLVAQASGVVEGSEGALFVQALRSGDQLLAVSSWRSVEDMQRYLDLEVTREFYRRLPALLMGMPTVRTYEVLGDGEAAGWTVGAPAGGSGR